MLHNDNVAIFVLRRDAYDLAYFSVSNMIYRPHPLPRNFLETTTESRLN